MIGETISHYRILERIGGGGMGVVYAAENLRLKTIVALKFLPAHLSTDASARERFIREARSASSLNHPNICTIHDVELTEDGQLFIAMARYEGVTLKKRLEEGPLLAEGAVDVARQMADGLAKAHEKEIIHRDIKPANVMLSEGRAVILDFGLAKLVGDVDLTKSGSTIGTVAYMSPEQLRGEDVDARTDVWSLGVVFYEMLTGRRPFEGEYEQAIMYSILNADPNLDLVEDVRHRALIERILKKDPAERLPSSAQVADELREPSSTTFETVQPRRTGDRPARMLAGLGIISTIAALAVVWQMTRTPDLPIELGESYPVTSFQGLEDEASWAPDGSRLAFHSDAAGNFDVWVVNAAGGAAVNLTESHTGYDGGPSWSPDGAQIAFWSDRDGGGCYVMSSLGGSARKVAPSGILPAVESTRPVWMASGSQLGCFGVRPGFAFLAVTNLDQGDYSEIPLPGRRGYRTDFSLSPNGRLLAYVDAQGHTSELSALVLLDMDHGSATELTPDPARYKTPFWSRDGSTLFFVSNAGGTMDLWGMKLDESGRMQGAPFQVTFGAGVRSASLSADGATLALSRGGRTSNVWRVPYRPDRVASWNDAEQLTFENAFIEFIDVSRDGSRLLYSSDRAGSQDIWLADLNAQELSQLTSSRHNEWAPMWSPSEEEVAYYSDRAGNRDIWVMAKDGRASRPLTNNPVADVGPTWSPDGTAILFASCRDGPCAIWTVPASGGVAERALNYPATHWAPRWSPDGQYLAFVVQDEGGHSVWFKSSNEVARLLYPGVAGGALQWLPDSHAMLVVDQARRVISLVPIDEKPPRHVASFTGRPGSLGENALTVDSAFVYFSWETDAGDIWLMDVVE